MQWPLLQTKLPGWLYVALTRASDFQQLSKTSAPRKGDAEEGEEMQFYWGDVVSCLSVKLLYN